MEGVVAEQLLRDAHPLHVQTDVEIVGHAHAAVHLHAFLHRERGAHAGTGLGQCRVARGVGLVGGQRLLRLDDGGPRDLDLAVQVRGAVLQCLESGQRAAELLALLDVAHRALEGLVARTHHLAGQRHATGVEHCVEQRTAGTHAAEHCIGADADAVEADAGRVVRIDHHGALDVDARGLGVDQEQRHAFGVVIGAGGASCHDQLVGHMAVDHQQLAARQREAAAIGRGPQCDAIGTVLGALVAGQRDHDLAGGDPGQPGGLLGRVAAAHQCRGGQHRGGQEGRGHQVAADGLHDGAGLHGAQAQAAMGLGHQHAREAHLGKAAPEVNGVTVRVAFVAQSAQLGYTGVFGKEGLRAVAQHGLFFVQYESHVWDPDALFGSVGGGSVRRPAGRGCAWR